MLQESLKKEVRQSIQGRVLFNVPMSRYTSLQVGGPADALVFPHDEVDLRRLVGMARQKGISCFVIGKGTNLLVRDDGFRGFVVNLSSGFRGISAVLERIRVGAGILLKEMIHFAMERGLAGLAPLYGIPGTVGGGLTMNAGAWGSEVKERVESITVMNGEGATQKILRKDLDFDYRRLHLKKGTIILEGAFLMEQRKKNEIQEEIAYFQRRRSETQPLEFPSAGSIFKNPPGASAGRIIEDVGLKGKKVGGAEVSTIHGNFVINTGDATASDVLELIDLIQRKVLGETGITLEPEVRIVGE